MQDPLDMRGRAVVVTGGTRGIGRAIASRFLDAGAGVLVCARQKPDVLPAAADGREAEFAEVDVRDLDQIDALMADARDRFGRLDVLVNNAGGAPFALAAEASPRLSAAVIDLNLVAPLNLCQRAYRVMREQDGRGAIVNIASVSGTRPSPGTSAYGAAKAGLLNLTQSLAVEWAPHVRVNAVTAGLIRTESSEGHYGGKEGIERVSRTVPMGRMGAPDDVADVCLFLASPMARYITGASVLLHGGGERPAFLSAAADA